MKTLYRFIYCQKLYTTILWIVLIVLLWSLISVRKTKLTKIMNVLVLATALFGIIYGTLIGRSGDTAKLFYPIPFSVFLRAKEQPELYREMLMNIFLFVPFGISLAFLLPEKFSIMKRLFMTLGAAFVLSMIIEIVQFSFRLGMAETDDILCNTMGGLVGALTIPISEGIRTFIRFIIKKNKR